MHISVGDGILGRLPVGGEPYADDAVHGRQTDTPHTRQQQAGGTACHTQRHRREFTILRDLLSTHGPNSEISANLLLFKPESVVAIFIIFFCLSINITLLIICYLYHL